MLSTLARAATRRPLTVMLLWGLFLLLGSGLGTGVFGGLSDDVPDVPGTESEVPPSTSTAPTRRASRSPPSSRLPPSPAPRCAPRCGEVADLREIAGCRRACPTRTPPGRLVAEDGRALIVPVTFQGGLDDDAEEAGVYAAADRCTGSTPPGSMSAAGRCWANSSASGPRRT
ncbi:hypothetical protein LV779_37305 [Streptomyces thinghirensis]|nr:hypothetical protein [Streptomyces thinghirensis]